MSAPVPCRACRAPIMFVGTRTGKAMPVDAEPAEGGNVRLVANGRHPVAEVLGPLEVQLAVEHGDALHYSHFATCPNANAFRH